MASELISRCIILVFGLLYPAYGSYKAIRTRSTSLYTKWMIYWIVFALFYNVETIADLLISWLPMYYEMKAIFVIWLLSPLTQGAQVIYKLYVHPRLVKHEQEIEQTLEKVKSQSYSTLLTVGAQGMNMALQGAIAGQSKLADQLKKSYSFDAADSPRVHRQQMLEDNQVDCDDLPTEPIRSRFQRPRSLNSELTDDLYEAYQTDVYQSQVKIRGQRGDNYLRQSRPQIRPAPLRGSRPKPGTLPASTRQNQDTQLAAGSRVAPSTCTRSNNLTRSFLRKTANDSPSPVQCADNMKAEKPEQQSKETAGTQANKKPEVGLREPPNKPRFTESTLRYRTKKISDIKSHKIESPFISMF